MMDNKEFVKKYVPFSALKKVGFFPKDMKFNNYDDIVERYLWFFDFKSIQEYIASMPELYSDDSFVSGHFADKVNSDGKLKSGGSFHLSLAVREIDIVCCICECHQSIGISTDTWKGTKKCKGCKRKIQASLTKDGIEVIEINKNINR